MDAVVAYMRTLKPDARFSNPPELSSIRILRPEKSTPGLCGAITYAHIASAGKNLVAIFAGPYRPGSNLQGGYLIYDSNKNSLSAIPQPPYDHQRVELTKVRCSHPPQATLCTWRTSTAEWVSTEAASFPSELSYPFHLFHADTCFAFGGSSLCWVDVSKGMVVCDLHAAGAPEFRFVLLPGECPAYDFAQMRQPPLNPEKFRSLACVGGSIKLVTMDGYGERPGSEVTMTVWTMSPDLCSWKKGAVCRVRDIWESESHLSRGLPQVLPSFRVLSVDKGDVVYLTFTDMDVTAEGRVELKSHYLIRVDMQRNELAHHPKSRKEMPPQLFQSGISPATAVHTFKASWSSRGSCDTVISFF